MLEIDRLSCRFGTKNAVDGVSLQIEPGSFVGIVGRSGAGKSTLLRLINRLVEPSAGRIRFEGTDVTALRGRELRRWRARAAMVFQQFDLIGRLDVLTNVLLGRLAAVPAWRSLLGLWPDRDKAMALAALEQFEIASLAARRADQLSGGQQQRVAIARALVQQPALILADEPIASLDPHNTRVVMDTLQRINRHFGITVLCNLHSLEIARSYCDRVVGMAAGRVVFDGAPAELTDLAARDLYGGAAGEAACPGSPRRNGIQQARWATRAPEPHRHSRRPPSSISEELRKMLNRRELLVGLAVLSAGAGTARAADWKSQYPELTFAVVPAENASGVGERYAPFMEYLTKSLGVPVKLRIANDYAAVIEGQRAGNIQIAYYGPASYSKAYLTGVKTEPFVTTRNNDGAIGYYSVIYVKSGSPYHDIKDLKGKTIGFVDPNSTSGYNAPRFYLNKAGIDVDTFFGKSVITGSHENAVIALDKGTVDCAADWWNADDDSNLTRMVKKGMAKKEDFRIVFKSALLPGSPYAMLTDLPLDLKNAIVTAFMEAPAKDKAAFDRLSDGKDKEFVPVTHKDYAETVEMIQYVDEMRKKRS